MLIPFPVEVPFRVRPDLRRLSGPLCVDDDAFERYRDLKRAAIERSDPPVLCTAPDDVPGLLAALREARERLQRPPPPAAAAIASAGVGAAGAASGASSQAALPGDLASEAHALALSMQEDFALLRPGPGGAVTELLHVCFPSGWAPEQKLGMSLGEVHAPVADGESLREAAPALGMTMLTRGPFERYVWTVADSAALSRHPAITSNTPVRTLDDLHFRCERQVLMPLPDSGRALFLIRVFVAPLAEVLAAGRDAGEDRGALLLGALRSMSPEMVRYKGLERQIGIVEQALGAKP